MLLVILPQGVAAQTVTAELSSDSVYVGERIELTISAEAQDATEIAFPADSILGDFEVFEREVRDIQNGTLAREAVYEVATFALDSASVPTLEVGFVQDGDTLTASTGAQTVMVHSVVPPEAGGLQPMSDPAGFPRALWPWLLAGLALLALAAAWLWYRDPSEEQEANTTPDRETEAISPGELALSELGDLHQKHDLTDPEEAKAFHSELSAILRRYLSRQLHIPAERRTRPEVMQLLRTDGRVAVETRTRLHGILLKTDLVKFADRHLDPETSRECAVEAQEFIESVEKSLRRARMSKREQSNSESPES